MEEMTRDEKLRFAKRFVRERVKEVVLEELERLMKEGDEGVFDENRFIPMCADMAHDAVEGGWWDELLEF